MRAIRHKLLFGELMQKTRLSHAHITCASQEEKREEREGESDNERDARHIKVEERNGSQIKAGWDGLWLCQHFNKSN